MEGESFESQVNSLLDLLPHQESSEKEHENETEVVLVSESGANSHQRKYFMSSWAL